MAKSAEAFRTISEVAAWLDTPAHVLRFWESRFAQVKPVKRAGGRRYYRPSDMLLLGGIKKLLHEDGLTIKGAQKILREKGVKHVAGLSQPLPAVEDEPPPPAPEPEPLFDDSRPVEEDTDYEEVVDEIPPPPSPELTREIAGTERDGDAPDGDDDDDDQISLFAEEPFEAPAAKPPPPPADAAPAPEPAPTAPRVLPRRITPAPALAGTRAERLRRIYAELEALRDRMRQPPA